MAGRARPKARIVNRSSGAMRADFPWLNAGRARSAQDDRLFFFGNQAMRMKQCRLKSGSSITTAWIDERGARVGANVELWFDRGDGGRSEMWTVDEVYPLVFEEDFLAECRRLNRNSLSSII
jgi:hypothetical protein